MLGISVINMIIIQYVLRLVRMVMHHTVDGTIYRLNNYCDNLANRLIQECITNSM